jgi:hypothetical protein
MGREALHNAHAVLVLDADSRQPLNPNEEVSIGFYSHLCRAYVHLTEATRNGSAIVVQYRFVNHLSQNMTNHFALIPLGVLPPGD